MSQYDIVNYLLNTNEELYETIQGKYGGLQLIVTSANGVQGIVATGDDCFIKQIPSQNLGDSADNQPWEFTCGRIQFYPDANV